MLTLEVIVRMMIGKKQIEREDEEIRDFVKCHLMPSPDDEEGEKFWKKVIDRMKEAEGVNAMIIYSFVRFDIVKKDVWKPHG